MMKFKMQIGYVQKDAISRFEENLLEETRDIESEVARQIKQYHSTVPTRLDGTKRLQVYLKNASIDFNEILNKCSGRPRTFVHPSLRPSVRPTIRSCVHSCVPFFLLLVSLEFYVSCP